MARIRSVKPELRTDETVNSWDISVRFFWVMLWGYCDDYGRGKDNARLIVADSFPLDDSITTDSIDKWMNILADAGLIIRYEVDGTRYFSCENWNEYQKVGNPSVCRIPCIHGLTTGSCKSHEGLTGPSEKRQLRGGGDQGEGKGGGNTTPPPRKCPKHVDDPTSPNCGACRDARLNREDWDKRQQAAPALRIAHNCTTDGHKFAADGYCVLCGAEKRDVA